MKNIIRFFAERPLIVNLITIFVIVIGFYSMMQTNKEGYPTVDRKIMYISTIYPGASPEEVEINVTIPLEEAIQSLDGIDEYTSESSENISILQVFIDHENPDPEKVKTDIRRALDNVDLPEEVTKSPEVFEWKVTAFPVIEIGLFSDTMDYTEIRTRAQDLEKLIKTLPDVSKVNERGILDREIKVKLNLYQLNENYISIEEVVNAIDINNFEITGGVYEDDNIDKIITVSSKLQSADDVGDIILRSTFEGYRIYLSDVAEIVDGFEDETSIIRFNGETGVSLRISKKETSDIITTIDNIKEVVDEYKDSIEGIDLEISYMWDLSDETRTRLDIVKNNAIIGLLLVVFILFLFMDFRNAFWTAAGIPFSIAFSMIFLRMFGVTINSISLLGVIVVLGMVVDDAIIISENIYRHRVMGKDWNHSAYEAAYELAFPVLATILTTIVAFLSLYNLKGVMGDFSKEIPLVVICVLTGSFIESLFILPAHVSHRIFNKSKPVQIKEKKFIIAMRKGYSKLLRVTLKLRWIAIIVFIGLFAWSIYVLFSGDVLKFVSFPSDEASAIYINGEVKNGQNLEFTSEKVAIIESLLSQYSNNIITSYSVEIGDIGYPEIFDIDIHLTPASGRTITGQDIVENIRETIRNENSFTNMAYTLETGGPGDSRDLKIEITGNDNDIRRALTDEIIAYLNEIEGTHDITRSDEQNKQELNISIDYEKSAMVGVSPISIAYTIRAAFNGVIATTLQTPEELIEYRVLLQDRYVDNLDTLYQLKVLNSQYQLIPVYTLIDTESKDMVSKIDHYNGNRNTIIEGDVDTEIITPTEVLNMIESDFSDFDKENPGFTLSIGGEAKDSKETIDGMIEAAIIAAIAILFILILQFKSISQAIIVIIAIPFSFIGVALVLLAHGQPLSSMALFGGVGLIGVVVNDSLVMVDHLNSLRKKMNRGNIIEIIITGASTRLRPVILTTLTTVAGLIPTAYGFGGYDKMVMPTTLVMSWGLVFATTLTLLLIPCLYMINIKTAHKLKRTAIRLRIIKSGRFRKPRGSNLR